MAAKYDVDDKVNIQGKVVEVVSNENGTTYQVKVKANNKSTTLYFEEDELNGSSSQSASTEQSNMPVTDADGPVDDEF